MLIQALESPADLLGLHRLDPDYYPYLLQSVLSGTSQARYDILFANPGEELRLTPRGLSRADQALPPGRFIDALDAWWREARAQVDQRANPLTAGLPFQGGWFLFLAYELAAELESVLDLPPDPLGLPIALARRVPCAIIHDHETGIDVLLGEPGQDAALARMQRDIDSLSKHPSKPLPDILLEEEDPGHYLEGIARIKDYIVQGDIFQVNLSRGWEASIPAALSSADLFEHLRRANPAPFAALARLNRGQAVISSSPERLISLHDGRIETRPIAGTRPRGHDAKDDDLQSSELLAHPKERAEHIMLIDLERNDLGRICVPGSVEVNELMVVESYRHVHHIVSNIRGRLRDGVTPGDILAAVFPGGTITGCPKIRCMQIIAELERVGRGAYTGALGYLGHAGDMDLNILIRTLVRSGARLGFRTGGGIVADSDPERELQETRHKAEGLRRALQ